LQVVKVDNPQSLAQAAKQSGLSMNDLRDFNPAYRTTKGTITNTLLLPKSAADQYKLGPVDPVADVPAAGDDDDGDAAPAKATKASKKSKAVAKAATTKGKAKATPKDDAKLIVYKVNNGESLWTIARRHQVSVEQLMKWNDLDTAAVKPGQVLKLTASR